MNSIKCTKNSELRHNLTKLQNRYGKQFLLYLKKSKIEINSTKCRAFEIKYEKFRQVRAFLADMRNQKKKKQETKKKRKQTNLSAKKGYTNYKNEHLNSMNLYVFFKISSRKLTYARKPKLYDNHILYSAEKSTDIFDKIMKIKINAKDPINFNNAELCNILAELQYKHKRCQYYNVLKNTLKNSTENKIQYEVNPREVYMFLRKVVLFVIPKRFFGNQKNRKKIMKAVRTFVSMPIGEQLNLKPFIDQLNLSCIAWLRDIKSKKEQTIILCRCIKWLFKSYFRLIIFSQFHVSAHPEEKKRKIYIISAKWNAATKDFIKNKVRKGVFKKQKRDSGIQISSNMSRLPISSVFFFPKKSGIRMVAHRKGSRNFNDDIAMSFLKQLNLTHFEKIDEYRFHKSWSHAAKWRGKHNKPLHIISCDVHNAFGSVVHGRMCEILKELTKNLPDKLRVQKYESINYHAYTVYTIQISDNDLHPVFPSGTLFTKTYELKAIEKARILNTLFSHIHNQQVRFKTVSYDNKKGVLQGLRFSTYLSEIYYNYIILKECTQFTQNNILLKYVDDILYICNDSELAKKFFQFIQKGIPMYNFYINKCKTQVITIGGTDNKKTQFLEYLGYKINGNNMEVLPNTETNCTFDSLIRFRALRQDNLEVFKRRMFNFTRLKLTNLTMDPSINSFETIGDIAKDLFLREACWARDFFLSNSKQLTRKYSRDALHIIRLSSLRVIHRITKLYFNGKYKLSNTQRRNFKKYLLSVAWIAYKKIFGMHDILNKEIVRCIKFQLKRLELWNDSLW